MFLTITIFSLIMVALFREQVKAFILMGKAKCNMKIPTTVRLQLTIEKLHTKEDKIVLSVKEIVKHIHNTLTQSLNEGRMLGKDEVELRVIKPISGREIGDVVKCRPYYRRDEEDSIYSRRATTLKKFAFTIVGMPDRPFPVDTFEPVSDENTNVNRIFKLSDMIVNFQARSTKSENVLFAIRKNIKQLENDIQYVGTMESLIDVEKFDVDDCIGNIDAEIKAVEKELELVEKLSEI